MGFWEEFGNLVSFGLAGATLESIIEGDDDAEPAPPPPDSAKTEFQSVETQAAQRRLARLSKFFTSPTGVLDSASTGSQGVFT